MYSFDPTEEQQQMLIDAVHKFAVNDLRAAAHEAEESRELPKKLIGKGWELGLLQASIPESYGGFGERSAVTGVLAVEEMAFGDLALSLAVLAPGLFATPILLTGVADEGKSCHDTGPPDTPSISSAEPSNAKATDQSPHASKSLLRSTTALRRERAKVQHWQVAVSGPVWRTDQGKRIPGRPDP